MTFPHITFAVIKKVLIVIISTKNRWLHDPNVLFQPLLMKILKHIWRVLSTHSGPYQGLNMITTDCQNCLNNFHFLNTIICKKGLQVYGGLTLTCNSRLPLPMDGRHSLHLGKNVLRLEKKNWAPPCWTCPPQTAFCAWCWFCTPLQKTVMIPATSTASCWCCFQPAED